MHIAARWTYTWFISLVELWTADEKASSPPDPQSPAPSNADEVFAWFAAILWSAGACLAIIIGVGGCAVAFASFVNILAYCAKSIVVRLKTWVSADGNNIAEGSTEENSFAWLWPARLQLPSAITNVTTCPSTASKGLTGCESLLHHYFYLTFLGSNNTPLRRRIHNRPCSRGASVHRVVSLVALWLDKALDLHLYGLSKHLSGRDSMVIRIVLVCWRLFCNRRWPNWMLCGDSFACGTGSPTL